MTGIEAKRQALLDDLSKNDIVVTYEAKRGALHANTRDINASGVTVSFHGRHLIEETELVINYGNRYGFIGPNGSGKVPFESECHVSCTVVLEKATHQNLYSFLLLVVAASAVYYYEGHCG
jgi:hypothetical protein